MENQKKLEKIRNFPLSCGKFWIRHHPNPMFPTTIAAIFGALLSILLIGCADHQPTVSVPVSGVPSSSGVQRDLSRQLFDEVNDYRRSHGLRPLVRHPGLDRMAHDHARFLLHRRGTFSLHGKMVSHHGFDGRAAVARERLGMDGISENIAATTGGTKNAPKVFRSLWVGSRGHDQNMRANWKFTGVGVATADDGTVIAVQMYGTSGMPSHQTMIDKFRHF